MSTAMGFRYLFDAGYIDREMDMWLHVRSSLFHLKTTEPSVRNVTYFTLSKSKYFLLRSSATPLERRTKTFCSLLFLTSTGPHLSYFQCVWRHCTFAFLWWNVKDRTWLPSLAGKGPFRRFRPFHPTTWARKWRSWAYLEVEKHFMGGCMSHISF